MYGICTNRNDWEKFTPYTNVLWLHYILDKMIGECYYKKVKTKVHSSNLAQLRKLKGKMLSYESATDFVFQREMNIQQLCLFFQHSSFMTSSHEAVQVKNKWISLFFFTAHCKLKCKFVNIYFLLYFDYYFPSNVFFNGFWYLCYFLQYARFG